MPISLADLDFAATLPEMSDEDFLLAWHEEVVANDEPRIMLVESAATIGSACPRGTTVTLVGFQARCAIASPRRSGSGERLSVADFIERRQWRPVLRPRRIHRCCHLFRRNVADGRHRLDHQACQPQKSSSFVQVDRSAPLRSAASSLATICSRERRRDICSRIATSSAFSSSFGST